MFLLALAVIAVNSAVIEKPNEGPEIGDYFCGTVDDTAADIAAILNILETLAPSDVKIVLMVAQGLKDQIHGGEWTDDWSESTDDLFDH